MASPHVGPATHGQVAAKANSQGAVARSGSCPQGRRLRARRATTNSQGPAPTSSSCPRLGRKGQLLVVRLQGATASGQPCRQQGDRTGRNGGRPFVTDNNVNKVFDEMLMFVCVLRFGYIPCTASSRLAVGLAAIV
ncbi:hypothetical protein GW17_00057425 [Ensete ventricosum]|nr:hypothetical protein GW17_00057425 [Ensete ventricosum]